MSAHPAAGSFHVVEHQSGNLLRLQAPGVHAMDAALELLGWLRAELHAEMESAGWRPGYGPKAATPVLIQLESLEAELTTDGNEIVLSRVAGSEQEFDDLCEFIREQAED